MPHKVTASSLQLTHACPGSQHLPWTSNTSEAADDGTACHEYLANLPLLGREEALKQCPAEIRQRMAGVDVEALQGLLGGWWRPEVTFAWHPSTGAGRVVGDQLGRDYSSVPDGWIVGTADAFVADDDWIAVYDWKTGRLHVPAPARNWQVKFLCVAGAAAQCASLARGGIVKIGEDGSQYPMRETWDSMELGEIAHELRENLKRKDRIVGPHCEYCPAWRSCPEQRKAGTALLRVKDKALTPALVRERAWPLLVAVEARAKALRAAIKTMVEADGPIDLGDGKQLGLKTINRRALDSAIVLQVINALVADGVEVHRENLQKFSMSKLKDELGTEDYKRAMDMIEKQGGIYTYKTAGSLAEVNSPKDKDK